MKNAKTKSEKMGKTELRTHLCSTMGMTQKQADESIDAVIDAITDAIKGGKSVTLPGLGTLSVKATAARQGVRPGTSEKIQIPAGKKVAFKMSTSLKGNL